MMNSGILPLISIIMPSYNRANLIVPGIESIIRQTYKNWELIIIDDGSTDGTKGVIDQFVNIDSRIKYVLNNRAKGVSGARNCGMLLAQGEYIAFLDSDDQWYDYHLADSIRMMQQTESQAFFGQWIERSGELMFEIFNEYFQKQRIENLKRTFEVRDDVIILENNLLERYIEDTLCIFNINTMVFKRELLEYFGMFYEDFALGEDTAFIINFFDHCRIAYHMKPHVIYNQSQDSMYFFCDRRQLDPDTLYQNKEMLQKIESIGVESLAFKNHLRSKIHTFDRKKKKRLLLLSNYTLARQYYSLSYINRMNKKKALRYCLKSMGHNINLFNILLVFHILLFSEKGSSFLKRPVDLW
ncbi:glycosyltransferase family 2 protein [Paenibacillus sp. GSMTC-2017]|uniref:glycosyltransferase family 2 protein n=1 Tax=Paenibacillus sp. GSMTC-2017 TaxID=2794350 RepID=UPI0018D830EF|nr:glycosyltransferase family 2 protein [Paenibacillus sp. GSMTC-2017]MBH5319723.1 glycosyltransferase family 2 protein [Paenibacillus sp. GSMTC-2017]